MTTTETHKTKQNKKETQKIYKKMKYKTKIT